MYTNNKFNNKNRINSDDYSSNLPKDTLYYELQFLKESGKAKSIKSIRRIGDADAPAPIVSAVYAGRKYALEIDDDLEINYSVRRDIDLIK